MTRAGGGTPDGMGPMERLGLVWAIVLKDLKQARRHGLPTLIVISAILLLLGVVGFSMVRDEFSKRGVPTWTGPILLPGNMTPPDVDVTVDQRTARAPATITFTTKTKHGKEPFNYSWEFGDGTGSDQASPVHTYDNPGDYWVVVTIKDSSEFDPVRKVLLIMVVGDDPVGLRAGIFSNATEGSPPFPVAFFSTVAGGLPPHTYEWQFGDGNVSNEPNPVHEFAAVGEYRVNLTVRDAGGETAVSNYITISVSKGEGAGISLVLVDLVFGFSVLVTMLVLSTAFSGCYNHEITKGTVRTLFCYPLSVLDLTVAKLAYAAVVGLVLSLPVVLLPTLGLGKPAGEVLGIMLTAYLLSLTTVIVAAFLGNALIKATGRMIMRPTRLPLPFLVLSLIFTSGVFTLLISVLAPYIGIVGRVDSVVKSWGPVIALSPYHQGGRLLSGALGGGLAPDVPVFIVPAFLLALGIWASSRLWPDIYQKE